MWGVGCLIWEIFNGVLPKPEQLKAVGSIPKSLIPLYVQLVRSSALENFRLHLNFFISCSANPATRPSPKSFLEEAQSIGIDSWDSKCQFIGV